jgi:hypothetical protein
VTDVMERRRFVPIPSPAPWSSTMTASSAWMLWTSCRMPASGPSRARSRHLHVGEEQDDDGMLPGEERHGLVAVARLERRSPASSGSPSPPTWFTTTSGTSCRTDASRRRCAIGAPVVRGSARERASPRRTSREGGRTHGGRPGCPDASSEKPTMPAADASEWARSRRRDRSSSLPPSPSKLAQLASVRRLAERAARAAERMAADLDVPTGPRLVCGRATCGRSRERCRRSPASSGSPSPPTWFTTTSGTSLRRLAERAARAAERMAADLDVPTGPRLVCGRA